MMSITRPCALLKRFNDYEVFSDDVDLIVRRCAVKKGDVFFTPSSEVPDDIGCSAESYGGSYQTVFIVLSCCPKCA